MNRLLNQLARHGEISWLSFHFAEFIAAQAQVDLDHPLSLSAALVCQATQDGSTCIDLEQLSDKPYFSTSLIETTQIPSTGNSQDWSVQLQSSDCVGAAGNTTPLTLDGSRLYLNRFWFYENTVAEKILALLKQDDASNNAQVVAQVERQFANSKSVDQDQKAAVLMATSRRLCVISGGPGSGKTSSVIRIIAVLLALDPQLRIALAAPTGKAAARMMDSIRQRVDQTDIDAGIGSRLPNEATTIHRLLDYRRHRYGRHEQHQLELDCVVIDEASMIDLKLMFHLLAALPRHARLILLGDRDQLASVAAGNVLGDITGHGCRLGAADNEIADAIALLRSNYRFDQDSTIGELALQVNQGQSAAAMALLRSHDKGIRWYDNDLDEIDADALAWLLDAYQAVFECTSPSTALDTFETTRLLCATNRGPFGVVTLNRLISSALLARNDLLASNLYHGLPIMIVRNQHELGLFNGDTGILWQTESGLRACFRDTDGGIRKLALNRLPEYIPAWASTVHKSQGSEFDSVLLVLPSEPDSEVLSRELLYTAITRARRSFTLHGGSAVVARAIENLTRRYSGLAERLGWTG